MTALTTTRFPDWPQRMDAAITAARDRVFGYAAGENQCCLFCGDVIFAMTGVDPAAPLRNRDLSLLAAMREVRALGGMAALAATLAKRHGWETVPVTHAQRGDAVLWGSDPESLAICVGTHFVGPSSAGGVDFMPMSLASVAWRVT